MKTSEIFEERIAPDVDRFSKGQISFDELVKIGEKILVDIQYEMADKAIREYLSGSD